MADLNSVALIGRLTRDPELKTVGATSICEFSIANNSRVKRGGEWQDECSFIDCTAFGKTGELISEFLDKGSQIGITGRLKQESWDDKQTGQKRSKTKVIVDTMQMLGGRGERTKSRDEQRQGESGEGSQEPANPFPESQETPAADSSEVPF